MGFLGCKFWSLSGSLQNLSPKASVGDLKQNHADMWAFRVRVLGVVFDLIFQWGVPWNQTHKCLEDLAQVCRPDASSAVVVFIPYLESHGELVSRFIMGRTGVIIWLIGFLTYLLRPHDPPSICCRFQIAP